ncbi:hypothetical protein LTR36_010079 [Oleoguttula mirabilis]|uniref:AN1-type domain-containing protein n=1 Tax=Oleoguttula mirabilis TaxID=1507867 RepID=A0AAV9JRV0_9PEZI|nr:hypothetical protein LTR36_010079 [Oleoguttula mirabilis]
MAPSRTPGPADEASYSTMATADVEAIGAHCQMTFCHQLDFLPFRCDSCKGKFCLDHRTETAHQCPKAGEWARRRVQAQQTSSNRAYTPTPKPSILTHEQQCSDPACKTLINTPLVTGVHCDKCNRSYCLKHRLTYEHNCANLTPLGARPAGPTQRAKGIAALEKLRAWGAAKKAAMPKAPASASKQAAAARVQATVTLKKTAKGDDKIPVEKRVYLHVEASSETITAKIPKGTFFYNAEYSVGRILDLAAKSLQVNNLNNRAESEEERLRVFHIEGGRLLGFSEKLGQTVQSGNTLVLLRGVGSDMASAPAADKTV